MDVFIAGDRYIKEASINNKSLIGIGITTHNRGDLAAATVARMLAVLPPGAVLVVVDDASDVPVIIPGVDVYRFDTNVGIAAAKNKCLELLVGCDHLFLFDDDTYPVAEGWWLPYVSSSEPHLMYCFTSWADGSPVDDDRIVYEDGAIVAHAHARGCMLYIERRVLDVVGGMDRRYGRAMNEHADWSHRIYNAGLTTFMYMDVPGSAELIVSMDQERLVTSSIGKAERRLLLHANTQLFEASYSSAAFAPYGRGEVISCYFTGRPDAQRGGSHWEASPAAVATLRRSVEDRGVSFALLHDCFDLPNLTTISGSPYFERWLKQWQYLRDNPGIGWAFVVDATDVDMLHDPFGSLEPGVLYVGDERGTLDNDWLLRSHLEPTVNNWLRANLSLPILNCGVVGGDRAVVMELCRAMYEYYFAHPLEETDMGAFNYIVHTRFADRFVSGRQVTTIFKAFEPASGAWFRHK